MRSSLRHSPTGDDDIPTCVALSVGTRILLPLLLAEFCRDKRTGCTEMVILPELERESVLTSNVSLRAPRIGAFVPVRFARTPLDRRPLARVWSGRRGRQGEAEGRW